MYRDRDWRSWRVRGTRWPDRRHAWSMPYVAHWFLIVDMIVVTEPMYDRRAALGSAIADHGAAAADAVLVSLGSCI